MAAGNDRVVWKCGKVKKSLEDTNESGEDQERNGDIKDRVFN